MVTKTNYYEMNADDVTVSVYISHTKKPNCFIRGYCYACNTGYRTL